MFIIVTEGCGCKPFQNHEDCRIWREQKRLMSKIDKFLEDFKRRIRLENK